MTVALTHGVFDLLHAGHMEHLRQCKFVSDRLIVSVVADRFVSKKFIIQDERTRMFQVSMVKGVDEVVLCDAAGPWNLLRSIKPDIYIRKDEYAAQPQPEYAVAKELGIKCLFTKTVPPHTKEIVQRIWSFKDD
ncbi:MAG: adenylyltransferase/cytidyltransferase family protein [Sulfuricaulis sp.]|nr:adenylyltransferase/cytidyltransferase family protein [Sulfuricaulis sp.]